MSQRIFKDNVSDFWNTGRLVQLYLVVGLAVLSGCNERVNKENETIKETKVGPKAVVIPRKDTTDTFLYKIKGYPFKIYRTKKRRIGTILALPGWNYPYEHWCDSTDLCAEAADLGYDIILPTMGKTIYSSQIYPQTRAEWKNELTRTWINDSLLPLWMNEYDVLAKDEYNCVLGLSTGGRGALLLLNDNQDVFSAGAALSGDFDMVPFTNDNLYRGFFGEYSSYQKVWREKENPMDQVGRLEHPFYAVHGKLDQVVPFKHTEILKESGNDEISTVLIDGHGHNYQFWASQVKPALQFFEEKRKE